MIDKARLRIILIHGNGGATTNDHWLPSLKMALKKEGFEVVARDFPDNEVAHEDIWLPFLKNVIEADENTILIGHSSGAVASMRYAEKYRIYGSVLVGVNYTDLGDPIEKESGFYNHSWDWDKIKSNQNWIIQFDSTDDPYIPISESRYIHEKLNTEYYEFNDRGHFLVPRVPEIASAITQKLKET